MSQLDISVDLNSNRVVGVDPTDSGPEDPEPDAHGLPHIVVAPHPAGGPDIGSCDSRD